MSLGARVSRGGSWGVEGLSAAVGLVEGRVFWRFLLLSVSVFAVGTLVQVGSSDPKYGRQNQLPGLNAAEILYHCDSEQRRDRTMS